MSVTPKKILSKISNKTIVFLIGILILSFVFRFYKIHDWQFFGMDQEYEAYLVKNILTGKHFPLIGVNASDTGIYLGPIFIYFAAIPYFFSSGNPIGWAITASLIGILTTLVVYKVGRHMFSKESGLLAAFIYAGSFLVSFYDRQFWNPTPIGLFSLLIGFLLYKILNNRPKMLFGLALLFGLAVQSHLSFLIFIPLIIYVVWKRHSGFTKKIIVLSAGIFLLTQLPLIVFEFKHNFINTKAAAGLITNSKIVSPDASSWKNRNAILLGSLGRFFSVPAPADLFVESGQCKELLPFRKSSNPEGSVIILVGIAIFFWWCFKKKAGTSSAVAIITGIFIATLFFIEFYNRAIFEYYLLFFFPWLAIVLGKSAEIIWHKQHGKLFVVSALILFSGLNLVTLFTSSFNYSYKDKTAAINFADDFVKDKTYSLEALGECTRFGGYRYLFEYFGTAPSHSYMDSYFSWLYPDEINFTKQPERIVLLSLIDARTDQETVSKWEKIKIQFLADYRLVNQARSGKIQVIILAPKTEETK